MPRDDSPLRGRQRSVVAPPPGAGGRRVAAPPPGARGSSEARARSLPALSSRALGAPMGAPPGATRPAPRLGGIRGLAVPPEVRRRAGAVKAAPGAAAVADGIRLALRTAQRKLLESQHKLQAGAAVVRARLGARR